MNKLTRLWRELGPVGAPLYLLHLALSRPTGDRARIEYFIIVAQPVHAGPLLPPGKAAGSEARLIPPGDPLLAQCLRPPQVIADRYAQGADCLGIVKGDLLQAYLWLVGNAYDEDVARVRYVLPSSGAVAWDFDVYVAPAYRLGFVFLKLWDAANAHLRKLGVHWSMSRISAFNIGSLSSHERLGAREIGRVAFVIVGPLQVTLSNLRPRFHVSLGNTRAELPIPEAIL